MKPRYDVPPPEWWGRAQRLSAQGYGYGEISRVIGRSWESVRYAVNEEFREKFKASRRGKQNGKPYEKRTKEQIMMDNTRRKVREVWREGGKKRRLQDMYNEAGC